MIQATIAAILLALFATACGPSSGSPVTPIVLATIEHEMNALVYIALDQGYFTENGLALTLVNYDTGAAAAEALTSNQTDLATCAEFIIVSHAYRQDPLQSFGTIAKSQQQFVFARTDHGIRTVQDLRGKRIGVPRGTVSEFYLGRFIELHGLSLQDLEIVDYKAPDPVTVLAGGNLDALITWQPYARQVQQGLGERLVAWPAQSNQLLYWNLIGKRDWVSRNPDIAVRMLKSLVRARGLLEREPDQARAIVQAKLRYDKGYMDEVWPEHQFGLTLDQSLIIAMEDEARWMIKNGLASAESIPDFLGYIYVDGLVATDATAVNVIR